MLQKIELFLKEQSYSLESEIENEIEETSHPVETIRESRNTSNNDSTATLILLDAPSDSTPALERLHCEISRILQASKFSIEIKQLLQSQRNVTHSAFTQRAPRSRSYSRSQVKKQ